MPICELEHAREVADGQRFEFGKNWARFLTVLTPERVELAEHDLRKMLKVDDLRGASFLDIGSGSGLSSLAARRLGARVHSFDFDPQSVACTRELRKRYFPNDEDWTVEQGSALDPAYLRTLGKFDLVYSWGVLHHTGSMWQALDNAAIPLAPGGRLFVAIYNRQPIWTPFYTRLKKAYVGSPPIGKAVIAGGFVACQVVKGLIKDTLLLKAPWKRYTEYKNSRGMSQWHDWIDWIGGYPFEAATVEELFNFYQQRGFVLETLRSAAHGGCHQIVFRQAVDHWTWTKEPYTLEVQRQRPAA